MTRRYPKKPNRWFSIWPIFIHDRSILMLNRRDEVSSKRRLRTPCHGGKAPACFLVRKMISLNLNLLDPSDSSGHVQRRKSCSVSLQLYRFARSSEAGRTRDSTAFLRRQTFQFLRQDTKTVQNIKGVECTYMLFLLVIEVDPASPRENHCDVSWVVSTPRPPVPASLHLLALQLKPNLSGLRAPEHPIFTPRPPLLVLIQVTQWG